MPLVRGTRRYPVLAGASDVAFSPADVAGLQLWFEADAGLYQDAAKTTPAVNDGDVVGCWADQSGNGNDATQATTSKKPLLKTGIVNGKPVVRFDGTDDYLTRSDALGFTGNPAYTGFAVIANTPQGSNNYVIQMGTDGQSTGGDRVGFDVGPAGMAFRFWNGNEVFGNTFFPAFGIAVWKFPVGGQYDAGFAYKNGSEQTATSSTNSTYTVTLANQQTKIGAAVVASDGSINNFIDGDIVELLVYDSDLSDADRQQVENYLNEKYNVY